MHAAEEAGAAPTAPPAQALLRLVSGAWAAQAVYAAAKLGVADLLADGPRPCAELAEATGTHAPSLYRVLRALAGLGVFAEEADGRFRLTPMAECLRTGVPGSVRPFAVFLGEEWIWRSWGEILHSVRTGEPAFERVFGMPVFEYYARHPEAGRVSVEGLASLSARENAAIVAAYDFSDARSVADVGGGRGSLLAAILDANPGVRGVLFDRPQVVEMARPALEAAGLSGRYDPVPGDFFTAVPAGADLYLMKKVIHDWDDERARTILANCRAAMPGTGRLLLIEQVVPPGNGPSYAKLLDLHMLVYTGGRERTEAEFRDLLASAGLELRRIVPTASNVSVVDAIPR